MNRIELIDFKNRKEIYELIHKWCSQKNIYEWFEQRPLSYDEIEKKYKNKLLEGNQKLFIINYDNKPIGFIQIYKYNDFIFDEIKIYKNIYEYDLFIGENKYINKGIGTKAVSIINEYIYDNYSADCIILRPFKRNINAIKCYQKNKFKIIKEYEGKDTLGNKETMVVLINTNN